MIRVVIDANVLVSALVGAGPSSRIVAAVFTSEQLDAVVCPLLVAEVADVLARPRIRKRVPVERAEEFLDNVAILFDLVDDPADIEPLLRDPDDDYLVSLARQHDVDWIITGDKDLLEWPNPSPEVIAPADFERRVLGSDPGSAGASS